MAVEHLRAAANQLDGTARGQLAARLGGLMREWAGEPSADIAGASPDELLALLDEQLGSY